MTGGHGPGRRRERRGAARLGLTTAAAALLPLASFGILARRGAARLMAAPRRLPGEAGLIPALDAMGGEIVRLRSRDGTRLSARWLPASADADAGAEANADGDAAPDGDPGRWVADRHEAILLLHGWSGSIVPDVVEYAPFLRRSAGVLGLDFGGHGESDDAPTTFGWREVEDVAGALAWFGERGIRSVVLVGSSMGGMTAIAAVAVLGDGSLAAADAEPGAPQVSSPAPRPQIVGVVADSVAPDLVTAVANRMRGPFRRLVAGRLFAAMAARLRADPRATEPIRVVGLIDPVPLLLIAGDADGTIPLEAAQRLAAAAGPSHRLLVISGADHARAHATDGARYEAEVTAFVRSAFVAARGAAGILPGRPSQQGGAPPGPADQESA